MILFQNAHALARGHRHSAAGSLQFTGQDLQECGLAGAVRADHTVAVSFGELDIDILKQGFLSKPEGYVINTDHVYCISLRLWFFLSCPILLESWKNASGNCCKYCPVLTKHSRFYARLLMHSNLLCFQ